MRRLDRYWIFFVIIAVGLALSWGLVGRKTHRLIEAEPATYLVPEPGCRPRIRPCAATAADRALVLGPAPQGLGLRQIGLDPTAIVAVEAVFISANGERLAEPAVRRAHAGWLIPEPPAAVSRVRIRVLLEGEMTVTEFPL
jgi:hypothetical protein